MLHWSYICYFIVLYMVFFCSFVIAAVLRECVSDIIALTFFSKTNLNTKTNERKKEAIKVLFIYLNVCLSIILNSFSCPFTTTSFLILIIFVFINQMQTAFNKLTLVLFHAIIGIWVKAVNGIFISIYYKITYLQLCYIL